ncbi:YchF/TatD family DNA exonuclease [Candidatus Ishikawella capsulata]|uniref:Predicted metallodependent hydrolase n=1 Tax=Candidatus Ishikawaella capsulata Mpkobe TaxID=476281 RepID=C5WD12_9ENTR|nr:YchF/TatD family DNA exonuclease [Candidatus Ishikawaella capsulata]BAH83218.1 predicted metallodependent hydrolase [Candidatus Ishikawaella capsulata Mpkobe]
MFIVDSHCHLDILDYKKIHNNLDNVINKAAANNVKFLLAISTNADSFSKLKKLIGSHPNIALSYGVHPLSKELTYSIEELSKLASEDCVIAIGETGLDYYYPPQTMKIQQQVSFLKHIRVGRQLNKPIIIHARNSHNDVLNILKEEKIEECGGVIHCFTEDCNMATKFLDMGLYISFSGIVTFSTAYKLKDAVRYVPIDRMLIETDSPYLAPVPYRGKENQPAYARNILEYIAKLKDIDVETLAEYTTSNFSQLFNVSVI